MFALQRSGDVFLGIPYDVALFSQILLYISNETGLEANRIDMNIIDAHIYSNQLGPVMDYLKTPMYDTPDFKYNAPCLKNDYGKVELINYKHGPVITAPVAV
jgi:thymidylate synthase